SLGEVVYKNYDTGDHSGKSPGFDTGFYYCDLLPG
ncbi:MAG: hypothetical protein JWO06_19, partial [Bacteroidota bacterium]|nr:hypothetical protein [Bacteroidota bacterium]